MKKIDSQMGSEECAKNRKSSRVEKTVLSNKKFDCNNSGCKAVIGIPVNRRKIPVRTGPFSKN